MSNSPHLKLRDISKMLWRHVEAWQAQFLADPRRGLQISEQEVTALMSILTSLNQGIDKQFHVEHLNLHRLGQCLNFISGLAQLDFDQHPLEVICDGGILDGIFSGLNMLAEELKSSVVSRGALEAKNIIIESIIENIPSAIFLRSIKDNYRVELWNKAAEDIFSIPREQILGKFTHNFFSQRESQQILSDDKEVVESGVMVDNSDGRWISCGGKSINVRTKKIPLRVGKSDEISYLLGVCEDVTASKESQQKLIASAKMSLLGEMAGGIAHEINNPLAIINAKANQLKKRVKKGPIDVEKLISDLTIIEDTTYRIAKIIKGLRAFSRNTEHDPMVTENLSQVINDAISLCSERFKVHEINLTIHIEKDLYISCRAAEIAQILVNLLSNSYDAIERLDNKWIRVEVLEKEEHLQIMVTDSGLGIPDDIVQKIMFPFYTTKDVSKGTGLGLSISQGIAKTHNGRLYYDETCKNTRFILELPRVIYQGFENKEVAR